MMTFLMTLSQRMTFLMTMSQMMTFLMMLSPGAVTGCEYAHIDKQHTMCVFAPRMCSHRKLLRESLRHIYTYQNVNIYNLYVLYV